MEYHEAANIFPMDEETLPELQGDIEANGQLETIKLYQGKILDGRRRHTACLRAGIKPKFETINPPDPIAYAVSLNLKRRQLSVSQRSMVGDSVRDLYTAQAKERQRESGKLHGRGKVPVNLPEPIAGGEARELAGKAVGVSGKSLDFAREVKNKGIPELVAAVEEGLISVSTAARESRRHPEEQKRRADNAFKNRETLKRRVWQSDLDNDESQKPEEKPTNGHAKREGVGIYKADEAINILCRIPKGDAHRVAGLKKVAAWIRSELKSL